MTLQARTVFERCPDGAMLEEPLTLILDHTDAGELLASSYASLVIVRRSCYDALADDNITR
jgi:hypothetical protein